MFKISLRIAKIAESCCTVHPERPACVVGNIYKITVGKNDLVCCKTPAVNCGICTVEVIAQIFVGKTEKSACKIHTARTAADINIRPFKSQDFLVNINVKMKCGDFGSIISVCIVKIITAAVFFKVNLCKPVKSYGIKCDGISVFIGYKLTVIADGNIYRVSFACRYG